MSLTNQDRLTQSIKQNKLIRFIIDNDLNGLIDFIKTSNINPSFENNFALRTCLYQNNINIARYLINNHINRTDINKTWIKNNINETDIQNKLILIINVNFF